MSNPPEFGRDVPTYRITVRYLDEYSDPQDHVVAGSGWLVRDHLHKEPSMVRQLLTDGLVFMTGTGKGMLIPPCRIVCIWFEET